MWKFKKEFKDKFVFLRGFGQINTSKVSADEVQRLSLSDNRLMNYIEKAKTTKSSSKKTSEAESK